MSRIDLDFAAPGGRLSLLSWLLLGLGLVAAAVAALDWQAATEVMAAAEARLAARAPVVQVVKVAKRIDPAGELRLREDGAARRALSLPWHELLDTLQDLQGDDVALLQLDADGHRGDFQISAAAKSYPVMLDYFGELQKAPALRSVVLTRHELKEIDGVEGVNFSLHGEWARP